MVAGGVADSDTGVSVGVAVFDAVAVRDAVTVGVPVADALLVAVCVGVAAGSRDRVAVADRLIDVDGDAVADAVRDTDDVADGAAVCDPVTVVDAVGDGVAVAATGAGATPRNCVPAAAVTIGAPPFANAVVATSNAYTPEAKGVVGAAVDTYTVAPSLETATATRFVTVAAEKRVAAQAAPATDATRTSADGDATHAVFASAMSKSFQYHVVPEPTSSGAGRVKSTRGLPEYAYSADGPIAAAEPDVGPMKNIVCP